MQNLRENVLQLHKLRANWAEKSAEKSAINCPKVARKCFVVATKSFHGFIWEIQYGNRNTTEFFVKLVMFA